MEDKCIPGGSGGEVSGTPGHLEALRTKMGGRGLGHLYPSPGQTSGLSCWTLEQPRPQGCCNERRQKVEGPRSCDWLLPWL